MDSIKLVRAITMVLGMSLFLGCRGDNRSSLLYPHTQSLVQERLFLLNKPLVKSKVHPTISFASERAISLSSNVPKAILDAIAPELVEGTIDLVGKSIVEISGKNDKTSNISASFSNFFYKNSDYNAPFTKETPYYTLLFVSAEFGENVENWKPKGLMDEQEEAFKELNLVGKPNFYMEAKIFPIPGKKYMEIVPTYIFYNQLLNPKGLDKKRDLEIRFSFHNVDDNRMLLSEGTVILKDVQVGHEYGEKELAGVRTTFIKMPKISTTNQAYSGAYNLKVTVIETRDINEWLASLGESISSSKKDISSTLYLTEEQKIERNTSLAKAKIEVEIIEAQLAEAEANKESKVELLRLKSQLLDKKAEANKLSIKFGKSKLY